MLTPEFVAWRDAAFEDPLTDERYDHVPPPLGDAPNVRLGHLRALLSQPVDALRDLNDEQIGVGLWNLWYVADEGEGSGLLNDRSLPLADRVECLGLIPNLYSELFVPRLPDRSVRYDSDRLSMVCFMLWDTFWFRQDVNAEIEALEQILSIEHAACQEAALHGLGHRYEHDPNRVAAVIDRWIDATTRPADLMDYARRARLGRIQ